MSSINLISNGKLHFELTNWLWYTLKKQIQPHDLSLKSIKSSMSHRIDQADHQKGFIHI